MNDFHLELALDDDRSAVQLRIVSDTGAAAFSARLEAPELDDLIRALGDGRANLADAVAPELDEGARITNTVVDPAYLVGTNSGEGRALIALRHPGLGWLGFQFRRATVAGIVDRMERWLKADVA